jgi:hypothetical protein
MPIRDTLTNLVAIQDGLSISSPVSQSIKKAYKYPPSRSQSLERHASSTPGDTPVSRPRMGASVRLSIVTS